MRSYKNYIISKLFDLSMDNKSLHRLRKRTVSQAHGNVLEIGVGSGLNLRHYSTGVQSIVGIDRSYSSLVLCRERAQHLNIPIYLALASAEALPLPDQAFDTIVATWTLCSIDEVDGALRELRRTLKPSGQLLFLEHGRASDQAVSRWQDALTHITRPLNGGCRINRSIADLLTTAGFEILNLRTGYAGFVKPFVYMYEGRARAC